MNNITLGTGISGEFRILINRSDGTTADTGWFKNMILDQGLDRLGNSGGQPVYNFARVGSGTSTPIGTQSQLDSQIAASAAGGAATANSNEGAPLYRTTLTHTYSFTQGAVIGNITEIGIGWATTGATLFSRALILDNLGSPTSITLVALDQLTVFYRLRIVPPLTDTTGSVTIGSTSYNYTARVLRAGTFGQNQFQYVSADYWTGGGSSTTYQAGATLGSIAANGMGGTQSGSAGTASSASYTTGTYYRDTTFTWSISQGNATGGIQGLILAWGSPYNPFNFQILFSAPIPKANTNVLSLVMRYSWTRA